MNCRLLIAASNKTQNSLTFFDQLLIRAHYPTGIGLDITRSSVWLQAKLRPTFPLRCANAQYHQIICVVKSHSHALARFQNVGKAGKKEKLFEVNV